MKTEFRPYPATVMSCINIGFNPELLLDFKIVPPSYDSTDVEAQLPSFEGSNCKAGLFSEHVLNLQQTALLAPSKFASLSGPAVITFAVTMEQQWS